MFSPMKEKMKNTLKMLKEHNQGHLLRFLGQLDQLSGKALVAQINNLDMSKIDLWADKYIKNEYNEALPEKFEAADYYPAKPKDDQTKDKFNKAKQLGQKLISSGKVGAFVVAGGQGTRLGFDGPKGNFPISPIKNKSLFQIFAETIKEVSKKYSAICPWYVMTSPLNDAATKRTFEQNDYFGLKKGDVFIFQQGTNPNFDFQGRILLADKDKIACSPDGHGGSLKALYQSGAVKDMHNRGIEYVSYWQVDNPLINIFDPLFIGLHALDNCQMSSKTLIKNSPFEKVGNFCLVDGKINIIEYSDLPDELAKQTDPDGCLAFKLGSIAIHIISTDFIESINSGGFSLPLHKAIKKIPYIDEQGNLINPTEPNGVKLESFIFDAVPLATNSIILETIRAQEFAPVKNATGIDSAETSKLLQIERAASWLESAGINIPRKDNRQADCVIEIAPSFALSAEDVKTKADQVPQINPGDKIYLS